ncbi:MAG: hypothetical protein AB4063_26040 [Crocosphaera sp.]
MDIIEARKKVKFDCQELLEHLLKIRIDKENLPEYIEHKFDKIRFAYNLRKTNLLLVLKSNTVGWAMPTLHRIS